MIRCAVDVGSRYVKAQADNGRQAVFPTRIRAAGSPRRLTDEQILSTTWINHEPFRIGNASRRTVLDPSDDERLRLALAAAGAVGAQGAIDLLMSVPWSLYRRLSHWPDALEGTESLVLGPGGRDPRRLHLERVTLVPHIVGALPLVFRDHTYPAGLYLAVNLGYQWVHYGVCAYTPSHDIVVRAGSLGLWHGVGTAVLDNALMDATKHKQSVETLCASSSPAMRSLRERHRTTYGRMIWERLARVVDWPLSRFRAIFAWGGGAPALALVSSQVRVMDQPHFAEVAGALLPPAWPPEGLFSPV